MYDKNIPTFLGKRVLFCSHGNNGHQNQFEHA